MKNCRQMEGSLLDKHPSPPSCYDILGFDTRSAASLISWIRNFLTKHKSPNLQHHQANNRATRLEAFD